MKHSNLMFTVKAIRQVFIVFMLLSFPLSVSYAKAGCCSHHGGVAGCDTATGHQQCKDRTDSPSCPCDGTNLPAATKAAPASKAKRVQAPATQPQTTTVAPASGASATKGCCSRHGGVAKCNTSTGYQMCKDGTQSGTCKCS